jgi:hypothetical protein
MSVAFSPRSSLKKRQLSELGYLEAKAASQLVRQAEEPTADRVSPADVHPDGSAAGPLGHVLDLLTVTEG